MYKTAYVNIVAQPLQLELILKVLFLHKQKKFTYKVELPRIDIIVAVLTIFCKLFRKLKEFSDNMERIKLSQILISTRHLSI